jgi:hypothetical protein
MSAPTKSVLEACGDDYLQAETLMETCQAVADGSLDTGRHFIHGGFRSPGMIVEISEHGTFSVVSD